MTDDVFMCKRCGYETSLKGNIVKHLKKKLPCDVVLEDISRDVLIAEIPYKQYDNKTLKCKYCETMFTCQPNRSRHMKTCKNKPIIDTTEKHNDDQTKRIEELEKLCRSLQKQLLATKAHTINNTNTNNTVNTTNHNINNIHVYPPKENKLKNFGFENMEAIPTSLIRDLFMDLRVRDLMENLHCDPDYPENHNIKIKSTKRNVMEIYRNDKWDVITSANGVDELIMQAHKIFKNFYRNHKAEVHEDMTEEETEEVLDRLDDMGRIRNVNTRDSKIIKKYKEELFCMLESFRKQYYIS